MERREESGVGEGRMKKLLRILMAMLPNGGRG